MISWLAENMNTDARELAIGMVLLLIGFFCLGLAIGAAIWRRP